MCWWLEVGSVGLVFSVVVVRRERRVFMGECFVISVLDVVDGVW